MKITSYWTQSPVFNGNIPNQYSLPFLTSPYHLKLQSHDRQHSTAHKLKPRLFHKSTYLWVLLVDFHPQCELCLTPTNVIATFHSLSDSSAVIGRYSNIVLIISCCMFFLSKNIICNSSVSDFMARASNSIIKSAIFFFPCLKVSIFHSVSVALILSLNVLLISCTKLFQSYISISLSSSLSFFWA